MLSILGWVVFGVVLAAAVPAQVLGLPGTWIIFADAVALRVIGGPDRLGMTALWILFLLAVCGEIYELYSSLAGAMATTPLRGSGTVAFIGALAGAVLGAPFFFGAGAVPGMAAGAFTAVFIWSLAGGRSAEESWRTGISALTGRLRGAVTKIILSLAMVIVTVTVVIKG